MRAWRRIGTTDEDWRQSNRRYRMSAKLASGMPVEFKEAVRSACARLGLPMSEVDRRLWAASGLLAVPDVQVELCEHCKVELPLAGSRGRARHLSGRCVRVKIIRLKPGALAPSPMPRRRQAK